MKNKYKSGVIISNLGSPDAPTPKAVRKYLREFLMDPRVIDAPYFFRWIIVYCFILPFRPKRSAAAYASIWSKKGSPLVVHTSSLAKKLQKQIKIPVAWGMRYGEPNLSHSVNELVKKGVDEIIFLPLYPHYALSSFETAVIKMKDALRDIKNVRVKTWEPIYKEPGYIRALCHVIRPYLKEKWDHVVFSYHGIPESYLTKISEHCLKNENCCEVKHACHLTCYRHQTRMTTKMVAKSLKIPQSKVIISYQSRLSRNWLEPFTDKVLLELGKQHKKILIVSPSFVADCLETLEELQEREKRKFLNAGGKQMVVVPCLNENEVWVNFLKERINKMKKEAKK